MFDVQTCFFRVEKIDNTVVYNTDFISIHFPEELILIQVWFPSVQVINDIDFRRKFTTYLHRTIDLRLTDESNDEDVYTF